MRTEFSQISVDKVEESYGKMQAQIRQTISKFYPSIRLSNSLSDALIPSQAKDIDEESFDEIRVTWATVNSNTTPEEAEESLNSMPNARIYKILSNDVILSDGDESWMETLSEEAREEFINNKKASQLVRTADGEIIKDTWGQEQYRRNAFTADYTKIPNLNEACVMDKRRKNVVVTPRIDYNPATQTQTQTVTQNG